MCRVVTQAAVVCFSCELLLKLAFQMRSSVGECWALYFLVC
jgi:hypothetical protein